MDLRKSGFSSFKQCAINASPLARRYAIKPKVRYMKINIYIVVTLFVFLFSVSGCDTTIEVNNRSGSINNDYIEEPLSKRSLQYESGVPPF